MSSSCFFLFLGVVCLFQVERINAEADIRHEAEPEYVVMTDLWGKSPVVELNTEDKFNRLGTTFQLGPGRTNLETWLLLGLISSETNDVPQDSNANFSLDIRSSADESSSNNILGQFNSPIMFTPDPTGSFAVKATQLSRRNLGQNMTLYIYKIYFNVPLRKKVLQPPEFISIWFAGYDELWHWRFANFRLMDRETASRNPPSLLTDQAFFQVKTNKVKSDIQAQLTHTNEIMAMPDVRLTISREKGFLLITLSPAVENAALEQANPDSYPLKWQPAVTETNRLTNSWYVLPSEGARIFRLRLSP